MIVDLCDSPEVVASVVTLGPSARLERCLESLGSMSSLVRVAIVCIVNGCSDVTTDDRRYPVTALRLNVNAGWSGGQVVARSLHTAPYFWLVQDDMTVTGECLDELMLALRADPDLGVVSPVAVDNQGRALAGQCYRGSDWDRVLWDRWPPEPWPVADLGLPDYLLFAPSRGSLHRTAAWDAAGGFDPRFHPVIHADVDYGRALHEKGIKTAITRAATVFHEGHQSIPGVMGHYLHWRNAQLFMAKWEGLDAAHTIADRAPVQDGFLQWMQDARPEFAGRVATMDQELIATVAMCASDAFLGLGREAQRLHAEQQQSIDSIRGELAQSRIELEQRYGEIAGLRQDLADGVARLEDAEAGATRATAVLQGIAGSRSWRYSQSARDVAALARRVRGQFRQR